LCIKYIVHLFFKSQYPGVTCCWGRGEERKGGREGGRERESKEGRKEGRKKGRKKELPE
jgi:hypothetical protein